MNWQTHKTHKDKVDGCRYCDEPVITKTNTYEIPAGYLNRKNRRGRLVDKVVKPLKKD